MDNLNDKEYLESTTKQVIENLRQIQGAPGVQMTRMFFFFFSKGAPQKLALTLP